MISLEGEDFMILAEANGLRRPTILLRYAIRNALLPQLTGLGLALGQIVSGGLLVEAVFRYPGLGGLLYRAILTQGLLPGGGYRADYHRPDRDRYIAARSRVSAAGPAFGACRAVASDVMTHAGSHAQAIAQALARFYSGANSRGGKGVYV